MMSRKNTAVFAFLFGQVAFVHATTTNTATTNTAVTNTVVENTTNERIEVIAQAPHYQRALLTILPAQQVIDETSFSADSVANLLQQSPILNLNGQGGLFQSINIRGFSRWRIQTLVEGIPIQTERRAGSAIEFIPPSFVSRAFVTQGAASTQLGSGAIGGGVDLILAQPQSNTMKLTYGHLADDREVHLQGRNSTEDTQWLLSHRHANNSEDAFAHPIQDGFEQHAGAVRHQFNNSALREGLLLYSSANNIAKASADDPAERFTLYPNNDHLLGKLDFDWLNGSVYFHQAKQHTLVARPTRRTNIVDNQFLDVGVQIHDDLQMPHSQLYWRAGIDARTNVKAFEHEVDAQGETVFAHATLDAQQWESFVSAEFSQNLERGTWTAGSRLAYQYQHDNLTLHTQRDTNLSAFIGYAHPLSANWQWSTYVSQAYRVPSLTERYFDGTTPRGSVKGSPQLKTETTLNAETSLSYQNQAFDFSLTLFQQDIDDYIERIRISEDLRAYRNLDSATVLGVSYQGKLQLEMMQMPLEVNFSGQWLQGENTQGQAISDISPAQHRLSLVVLGERSHSFLTFKYRQSSNHLVDGELPVASVLTLDAGYKHQLNDTLTLAVNLTNLTDRDYVTSRDDLAPFAKGRDIHVSCEFTF